MSIYHVIVYLFLSVAVQKIRIQSVQNMDESIGISWHIISWWVYNNIIYVVVWIAWQLYFTVVFSIYWRQWKKKLLITILGSVGDWKKKNKIKTNHARRRRHGFRKDTGCVGVVKRVFPGESGSHLTFTRRAAPPRAVVWPTYQDQERLSPSPSPRISPATDIILLKNERPVIFCRAYITQPSTRPFSTEKFASSTKRYMVNVIIYLFF